MRRPSSIETFTPSAAVSLHPALILALDNLDVQLEEELARYRRRRQLPPDLSRTPWTASKPAAVRLPQPRLGDPLPEPAQQQVQRMLNIQRAAAQTTMPPVEPRREVSSEVPSKVNAPVRPLESQAAAAVTQPPLVADEAELPRSVPLGFAAGAAGIAPYTHPDLADFEPSAAIQKFVHHPLPADPSTAYDGYLDSSEELLRSIAEEDPDLRAEPEPNRLLDTLLTPIGIGSMLLLLLSSVTLGYVIMNPTSLQIGTPEEPSEDSNSTGTQIPDSAPSETADRAPSPNLAAEEFVDLNLDNLGTLPRGNSPAAKPSTPATTSQPANRPKSAPTQNPTVSAPPVYSLPEVAPAPMPAVTVPSQPAISTPAPAPAVPPAVAPEPVAPLPPLPEVSTAPLPAPDPTGTAPAPTESVAPSATTPTPNYVYVMTDYSGDTSLQQARTVVPDAYVRNLPSEGARVQLGAFSEEEKAQELLQELQQQGIPAEIYRP